MTEHSWQSERAEILREHEEIYAKIARIEAELDRLLDQPAKADEDWELPGLVKDLHEQFQHHFVLEEEGELFRAGAIRDPQTRREVEDLCDAHRALGRILDRLVNEVEFSFVPNETVQACFDGDLRRLIVQLTAHEIAENALFDKLFADARASARDVS